MCSKPLVSGISVSALPLPCHSAGFLVIESSLARVRLLLLWRRRLRRQLLLLRLHCWHQWLLRLLLLRRRRRLRLLSL